MNKYQRIMIAASIAALALSVNAKQLPPIKFEGLPPSVFEEGYKEGVLNFLPIPTNENGKPNLTVHMHGNNGAARGSDADREMEFENDAGGWSATHVAGKRFSLVSLLVDTARFQPTEPNGQKRPFVFDAIRDGSKVATTVVPLGMKGVVTFPSGFSDIDKFEVYVEGMRAQYPDIAIIKDFLLAVDDIVVDDLEGSDTDKDSDKDGLNDAEETELGTDPQKPDTDGDGSNDKAEIDAGTDPLLATSKPDPATNPQGNGIFPKEGMWWNPQRSGHGVDIEYDGTNISITWYTYNDDGTPTWYLAAGPFSGDNWTGKLDTYTWDGTKAIATPVGTATFEFTDQTHAKFSWVIDGVAGNEPFEYLVTSDQPTTQDFTGIWFETAKPGYGLTISTQGATEFGVLYFYDNQGLPRWALGVKQDSDTYTLDQYTNGFCPVCTLTEPVASSAGTITRSFTDSSKGVLTTDIQLATPLAGNWKIDDAQINNLSNP